MYHHRRTQGRGISEYMRNPMTFSDTIPKEPEKPPVPKEPERPPVPKEPERPIDPPIPPVSPEPGKPDLDPLPGRSDPKLPNWRSGR